MLTPEETISLSQDRRLSCGDLTGAATHPREVDELLSAVAPFLKRLETECVAGCCGIDAYRFWPESIQTALQSLDAEERAMLPTRFRSVCEQIDALPDVFLVSTRMNNYFRRDVLVALLRHIAEHVEHA